MEDDRAEEAQNLMKQEIKYCHKKLVSTELLSPMMIETFAQLINRQEKRATGDINFCSKEEKAGQIAEKLIEVYKSFDSNMENIRRTVKVGSAG